MFPFKVSQDALSRTLRILDVFLSELDKNKYTLNWPSPYNTPIEIISDGASGPPVTLTYVDPLADLNWTIGQFKNPPWF